MTLAKTSFSTPTAQLANTGTGWFLSMLLWDSSKFQVNITHRFLESGHSYSEVDSMHGRIERESRHKDIFTLSEWLDVMNAKQSGESYRLNLLRNQDVMNLHDLVDRTNWDRNLHNNIVKWSKVREVLWCFEKPNSTFYLYGFEEKPEEIQISLKDKSKLTLQNFAPPKAYAKKHPLQQKKLEDLRWLCD